MKGFLRRYSHMLAVQVLILAALTIRVQAVMPAPVAVPQSVPAAEGSAGDLVMVQSGDTATDREDVVSFDLPVQAMEGTAPFDFHIDPQRLIEETGAARYGGGFVEAGATLLFHNTQGPYTFSSDSDRLDISNSGTVPVNVTIEARIEGLRDAMMTGSYVFTDPACSIYLALTDDEGLEAPILEDGVVRHEVTVEAAETYAFGLTGAVNPLGDWKSVYDVPVVTVTWYVVPAYLPEEDDGTGETVLEETTAGEGATTAAETPVEGEAVVLGTEQVPASVQNEDPSSGASTYVPQEAATSASTASSAETPPQEVVPETGTDPAAPVAVPEASNPEEGGSSTPEEIVPETDVVEKD